ncbi:MAG: S1 RNA-binding domain-containing protein, partial [Oscillospiraceae bacterium]
AHVGETFSGVISSVTSFGVYVELESTAEGLIRIENLDEGEYIFDEKAELTERYSGKRYRVGDRIEVVVTGADVSGGKVDFVPKDAATLD